MITKERLEELIREETIIYYILYTKYAPYVRISECKLNNKMYVDDDILCLEDCDDGEILYLNDIFETKEDAEWHREFSCIERTERLELPTWEEFLELNRHCIEFHFITKEGDINYIVISDMYMHNDMLKPKDEWTIIIKDFDDEYIFEKPATKENYTLACRKCKELFLGEKK